MTEFTAVALGDHWVERRRFFDDGHMLIERRDSIALAHGVRATGTAKSGKTWSSWNNKMWTFYSMKPRIDGSQHLTSYRRDKKSGGRGSVMANVTSLTQHQLGSHIPELWDAVYAMCDRAGKPVSDAIRALDVNHRVAAIAFPFLAATIDESGKRLARKPAFGLAAAMRADNPRDFATTAFGRRLIRKDLIRATATADMSWIAVAVAIRHLVPVDWIVEMLSDSRRPGPDYLDLRVPPKGIAALLALVPEHRRRRLLADRDLLHSWFVRDAIHDLNRLNDNYGADRSWATGDVTGARTWRALHDALAVAERKIGRENLSIEQDDVYQQVDGTTLLDGRLRIVSAKHTDDLGDWGEAMSNCINGYRLHALRHQAYLYGLYDHDALIANIEVAPDGRVVQLLGRFNQPIDDDLDQPVRHVFALAQNRARRAKLNASTTRALAA